MITNMITNTEAKIISCCRAVVRAQIDDLSSRMLLPFPAAVNVEIWWALLDLNQRPTDYESAALTN